MRAVALGLFLPAVMLLGSCIEPPAYLCTDDSVCVLNNVQGQCELSNQVCVYPGPECPSNYRDGHGNCVDGPIGMSSSGGDSATSTTTATSTTDPTDPVDPSNDPTTEEGGEEESTTDDSEGMTTGTGCANATQNITADGVVGASTVFSGYPPILSVDGDLSTSWFSTGPEGMGGGDPSVYTWTLTEERCISRISLSGNGLHSNPAFREDFGFDSVTIRVFNDANDVVFEGSEELPGTPDPDVTMMPMGVMGSRVLLEFLGHESEECGGFSELTVLGQ